MSKIIKSFAVSGVDGYVVDIEASVLPDERQSISIIGMGDAVVKESGERIRAAFDACGYALPEQKIVLSLAPADMRKRGSAYDLALAVALLSEAMKFEFNDIEEYGFLGELTLSGELRPCCGILPMLLAARNEGIKRVVVPCENFEEACLVKGVEIYAFHTLNQVVDFLLRDREGQELNNQVLYRNDMQTNGRVNAKGDSVYVNDDRVNLEENSVSAEKERLSQLDFSDVKGQDSLIDAIVLAVAGGHNLLMIGAPGCGKTMIAKRIPSIMPQMTEEEALEVTKIHSIAGLIPAGKGLVSARPYRAPHHNVSGVALIGGGVNARPGEISLSHNGVLFLDEFGEFPKQVMDSLRQPLEDKVVTVSRMNYTNTYPANFILVAAMNPCPCGFYPTRKCRCSDNEIIKYRNKISGPVLDRIDIQKQVMAVDLFKGNEVVPSKSSEELRAMVEKARAIQNVRYKNSRTVTCNAQMTTKMIDKYCHLDEETTEIFRQACDRFGYSARVIHKLLRLARTKADLNAHENITKEDIMYVLHCRDLDKGNLMYR